MSHKTHSKVDANSGLVNPYEHLPKEFRTGKGCEYKNYKKLKIPLNSRIMIVGCSGSGKTSVACQLPKLFGCHDRIYLFAKNLREPLYAFLIKWMEKVEKKLGVKILYYTEDEDEIPDVDSFDPQHRNLIVMDDLIACSLKTKRKLADIWIRSRKQGCTCVFLTQEYGPSVPAIIRRNTDVIILKKISTLRNLKFLMSEYNLGVPIETLLALYRKATKDFTSFLMIDTNAPPEDMFRIGFKVVKVPGLEQA